MTRVLAPAADPGEIGFTLTGSGLLLVTLLALAMIIALALIAGRQVGDAETSLRDRLRMMSAVNRYDFWLDVRGVRRRRRKDLRAELRVNLTEAARRVGAPEAVRALGSLRQMSAEAMDGSRPGPYWQTGALSASAVFLVVVAAEMISLISWLSGADASGAQHVSGALPLFPASEATYRLTPEGLAAGLEPGWLIIVAPVLAYLLASRPWLALRSRGSRGRRR